QPALLCADERFTWREFNMEANRYAAFFLKQGLRRGDVVALLMDNRADFLFVELGLNKIGAISALINTELAAEPLAHAINAARPRRLVLGSEHVEKVRDIVPQLALAKRDRGIFVVSGETGSGGPWPVIDAEVDVCSVANPRPVHWPNTGDPMSYLYTSGTTGLPKPAVITNQRCMFASCAFARVALECGPGDVIYSTLPLYHGSAQWGGLGACLYSGATLALRRRFSASRFWEDVRKLGATHFLYIGELCRYLLNQPPNELERTHKLRMGVGNGLRPDIWHRFQERFAVPLMREFYGATEGNAPLFNHEGRLGMVGTLRLGQAILRCDLETGEVLRNSRGLCEHVQEGETGLLVGRIHPLARFDGYLDERDTRKKTLHHVFRKGDSYFDSGDLLTLHADSWVSFADRVGDTYRYKGENVSAGEVAEVLNQAPGVLESIVYGVQVPGVDGRVGMASLNTAEQFDLKALAEHVRAHLASYQRPQFVRLDAALNTTSTLKHKKTSYRTDGFDPASVPVPLHFWTGSEYVPLDADLHRRLVKGELSLS
ncbi:MAG TPA: AMP-binding protein, partial [Polyangiaceae bacterium]|nr:AMP-binding protein [Polyangiaceae bacterium]